MAEANVSMVLKNLSRLHAPRLVPMATQAPCYETGIAGLRARRSTLIFPRTVERIRSTGTSLPGRVGPGQPAALVLVRVPAHALNASRLRARPPFKLLRGSVPNTPRVRDRFWCGVQDALNPAQLGPKRPVH